MTRKITSVSSKSYRGHPNNTDETEIIIVVASRNSLGPEMGLMALTSVDLLNNM